MDFNHIHRTHFDEFYSHDFRRPLPLPAPQSREQSLASILHDIATGAGAPRPQSSADDGNNDSEDDGEVHHSSESPHAQHVGGRGDRDGRGTRDSRRMPPPPAGVFDSLEELKAHMHTHCLQHGYDLSNEGGGASGARKTFACTQRGQPKRGPSTGMRPNRQSKRKGCQMAVIATAVDHEQLAGKWKLKHARITEHNHGPSNPSDFPAFRRRALSLAIRREIEFDFDLGNPPRKTLARLLKMPGGEVLTNRDIYNEQARISRLRRLDEHQDNQHNHHNHHNYQNRVDEINQEDDDNHDSLDNQETLTPSHTRPNNQSYSQPYPQPYSQAYGHPYPQSASASFT